MSLFDAVGLDRAYRTVWFVLHERGALANEDRALASGVGGGLGLACINLAHTFRVQVLAGICGAKTLSQVGSSGTEVLIDILAVYVRDEVNACVLASTQNPGVSLIGSQVGATTYLTQTYVHSFRRVRRLSVALRATTFLTSKYLRVRRILSGH
ncbi:MDR/zinc-dependent alcohol dehydrogenase-like family protein [Bordetella petrii]|nr:hypothetical protein [Bordetella petrii]